MRTNPRERLKGITDSVEEPGGVGPPDSNGTYRGPSRVHPEIGGWSTMGLGMALSMGGECHHVLS
jgi:hypothetical protein